jgi:hypothetical protein
VGVLCIRSILSMFPSDLPGVNPAILNKMVLYYRLMTKWSGLGDSTELSRMGLSHCSLRRRAVEAGRSRRVRRAAPRAWSAATPMAEAATEARRGSRVAEEQGISARGASSLPRGAGRQQRRGELGRRSDGSRWAQRWSAGSQRVRDMVELRDGGAQPVPQLRRWLMFLLHQQ